MIEKNDNQVVKEVLTGNIQAFGIIIKKYQNPIFNLAMRMVKDYDDAKDITQNTFIKAYNKLTSFDNDQVFFSWIYRIAVNESLNSIKSKKSFNYLDDEKFSISDSPDDSFVRNELYKSVNDAILELSPEYRTVIILKHLNGLSYQEISEITGITEEKVKSRLFTARKRLKDLLEKNSELEYGK